MKKNLTYIALAILVITVITVLYYYTKPLESVANMDTHVTLSSQELLTAFETNETLANSIYLDKVVSVKGEVEKIEQKDGKSTIFLKTGNELSYVICQLDDSQVDLPSEGTEVNIKGICTGYLMDVVVVRGIIE